MSVLDINNMPLSGQLMFMGSVETLEDLPEAKAGDLYFVKSENTTYINNGSEWLPMASAYTAKDKPRKIVYKTNCKNCGAVLYNNKCEYCGTINYIND